MQVNIEHLSRIAQRKVRDLMEQKELLTLQKTATTVTLTFDGSSCVVDYHGRVSWLK